METIKSYHSGKGLGTNIAIQKLAINCADPESKGLEAATETSKILGKNRQVLLDHLAIGTYDASITSAHKLAEMDKKLDKIGKALKIDFEA